MKWYDNLKPAHKLILALIYWGLFWGLMNIFLKWFGYEEKWIVWKEVFYYALVGGISSNLIFNWKLVKKSITKGGDAYDHFETIE